MTYRTARILTWLIVPLMLAACQTIQLVSDYDETTEQTATALQRKMTDFFLRVQALPAGDPGLRFAANQDFYREVTVDLNTLQVRAEGLRLNSATVGQLQALEDSLALLVLQHKGCLERPPGSSEPAGLTAAGRAAMQANGVDLSLDCRTDFGARSDLSDRGDQLLSPIFAGPARQLFDQNLAAIIALELAKRRGE